MEHNISGSTNIKYNRQSRLMIARTLWSPALPLTFPEMLVTRYSSLRLYEYEWSATHISKVAVRYETHSIVFLTVAYIILHGKTTNKIDNQAYF